MLQAMYLYVGVEAQYIQFGYLWTLQKPMKSSMLDHAPSQMLTLAHYENKLTGTKPPLTYKHIKKYIFQSFPLLWQQQYIRSGQCVANTPLSDIVEFMSKHYLLIHRI
jgi:hypothetical protein